MAAEWIDISVPLKNGMVHWPGDPAFQLERSQDMASGDVCTVSRIALGVHSGTHMDAPAHFVRDGATMDALPLDAVMGEARVIEIEDRHVVSVRELEPYSINAGERLLFKTRNSTRCWQTDEFVQDFVYIPQDTARFLAEKRVRTVGIDYLSVSGYERDLVETHEALLGAGIWVIEGLNLAAVSGGRYDLVCLPLKIAGAEGAPARAVLRPL